MNGGNRLTRRTLIQLASGTALTVGLTACAKTENRPETKPSGQTTATESTPAKPVATQAPDLTSLNTAIEIEYDTLTWVNAALAKFSKAALAPYLTDLVTMHQAHLDFLLAAAEAEFSPEVKNVELPAEAKLATELTDLEVATALAHRKLIDEAGADWLKLALASLDVSALEASLIKTAPQAPAGTPTTNITLPTPAEAWIILLSHLDAYLFCLTTGLGVAKDKSPIHDEGTAREAVISYRRDDVARIITRLGEKPPAPLPHYEIPGKLTDPGTIQATWVACEQRVLDSWCLVSAVSAEQRQFAVNNAMLCVHSILNWKGTLDWWPGWQAS